LNLAAGLLPQSEVPSLLGHSVRCRYCGPLLKIAIEDLAMEFTPEEEARVKTLESAKPEWQEELVRKIAAGGTVSPGPKPSVETAPSKKGSAFGRRFSPWPQGAWATAATALMMMASWWGWTAFHEPTVEQLLARAYTEHRTLEMRIPGAAYGPMREERGAGGSHVFRSAALSKAISKLADQQNDHSHDPVWLRAEGRAELLEGNYPSALETLKRAKEANPDSIAVMIDLATAYTERGDRENRPEDYGAAIEVLGEVLQKSANDPVALFNRALAYERLYAYGAAVSDWKLYLSVDHDPKWNEEAKQRLAELQKTLKEHTALPPLMTASQIAEKEHDPGMVDALDIRAEEYLELAVTQWLPGAFPLESGKEKERLPFRVAVGVLAGILESRHGDRWIADILAGQQQDLSLGVSLLAKAWVANQAGNSGMGIQQARRAEIFFQRSGNRAGEIRAWMEEIYGWHRSLQGDQCLARSVALSQNYDLHRYRWIEGQFLIEKAICLSMIGDVGKADDVIRSALDATTAAAYQILYLRAIGIDATLETAKRNGVRAWAADYAGLKKFWSGSFPVVRAFQFYSDMGYPAEYNEQWHLAAGLAREALGAISATSNRPAEAIAHQRLAQYEMAAGNDAEAEAEFSKASQMFIILVQEDSSMLTLQTETQIALAKLRSRRGETEVALRELESVRPRLQNSKSHFIAMAFYEAMASLHAQNGNSREEEKYLLAAIAIAEWKLRLLNGDLDRVTWNQQAGDVYRQLVDFKLRSGAMEEGLEMWEWFRASALRSTHTQDQYTGGTQSLAGVDFAKLTEQWSPRPPSGEVRQNLSDLSGVVVVAYADLPQGPVAWVYDDQGIHFERLPVTNKALEELARRFSEECADPRSDLAALRRDGRRLYDWLVAPVKRHFEGRTVIIEPDRIAGSVPFQALVTPDGDYLGLSINLSYSPGLEYLLRLRSANDKFSDSDMALVVGAPSLSGSYAKSLAPLRNARREAEAVARHFSSRTLVTGNDATMAVVMDDLAKVAVVHFAGHTVVGPGSTGLLLASGQNAEGKEENKVLNTDRLASLRLNTIKLVVLSACSTMRGHDGGLSDSGSLARGFLRAGVPRVVASHWDVDSASTSALMDSFYTALFSGQSPAAALRKAEDQLQRDSHYSHPYYWAAFSVIGRG